MCLCKRATAVYIAKFLLSLRHGRAVPPPSFSLSLSDEGKMLLPQTEKEPRSPVLHGSFLVPVYVRALYRKSNGCR